STSPNAQRTCHQDDQELLAETHGCLLLEAGPRREPPLAFAGPILQDQKRKPGGSSRRDGSAGKACVSFPATVTSQVLCRQKSLPGFSQVGKIEGSRRSAGPGGNCVDMNDCSVPTARSEALPCRYICPDCTFA